MINAAWSFSRLMYIYCWLFFLGQTPNDQVGVGIFYNNRQTRRLTGTFDKAIDLNIKKEKSSCLKCN